MPTHNIDVTWSKSNETVTKRVSASADSESNLDIAVPAATTDKLVNLAIDVSELESLFLLSDKDVSIETNSGSAPDNTIALTANVPVVWYAGCGYSNPLTADTTKFYITNAGASEATVNIRVLQDSTP